MLLGRSAASKLRRKSQREAAELREQSDATLAMEEEELAREEEDEIFFLNVRELFRTLLGRLATIRQIRTMEKRTTGSLRQFCSWLSLYVTK